MIFRWKLFRPILYECALTHRHRYAVSLRVQRVADLHQVTVAFHLVLDAGRFHQKRVPALALQHPVHPFLVAFREHRRVRRLHHAPHPLVQAQVGSLCTKRRRRHPLILYVIV